MFKPHPFQSSDWFTKCYNHFNGHFQVYLVLDYSRGGPKALNRSLDVLIYATKTLLLKYTEIKK